MMTEHVVVSGVASGLVISLLIALISVVFFTGTPTISDVSDLQL